MLSRRLFVISSAAMAGCGPVRAQPAAPTPQMTEGPFYPDAPAELDNDLVRVTGAAARAMGVVLHLSGQVWRIQAGAPRPAPGALVEIWQCDVNQRYHHPAHADGPRPDDGFQGYGRTVSDAQGRYRFRTIRPVAYDMPLWGRPVRRAPHIHFAVSIGGRRALTTQMFVEGEPLNASDGIWRRLGSADLRRSVTIALEDGGALEPGALRGRFDLLLA
jgi:protocatechuate 3,4-dioxygenase beta subunit